MRALKMLRKVELVFVIMFLLDSVLRLFAFGKLFLKQYLNLVDGSLYVLYLLLTVVQIVRTEE